uniref:Uncharacterized protein n=1 Tax=Schizaphis graminum TaxID=13262 RepID=A0A2S2NHV9_SCHGA
MAWPGTRVLEICTVQVRSKTGKSMTAQSRTARSMTEQNRMEQNRMEQSKPGLVYKPELVCRLDQQACRPGLSCTTGSICTTEQSCMMELVCRPVLGYMMEELAYTPELSCMM